VAVKLLLAFWSFLLVCFNVLFIFSHFSCSVYRSFSTSLKASSVSWRYSLFFFWVSTTSLLAFCYSALVCLRSSSVFIHLPRSSCSSFLFCCKASSVTLQRSSISFTHFSIWHSFVWWLTTSCFAACNSFSFFSSRDNTRVKWCWLCDLRCASSLLNGQTHMAEVSWGTLLCEGPYWVSGFYHRTRKDSLQRRIDNLFFGVFQPFVVHLSIDSPGLGGNTALPYPEEPFPSLSLELSRTSHDIKDIQDYSALATRWYATRNMQFLDMVIQESLRIYPPIPKYVFCSFWIALWVK